MPVSGVIPEKMTKVPLPLTLPSSPARSMKPHPNLTSGSMSSFNLRTATSSSKAGTQRAIKPPTPITPGMGGVSMRDHALAKPPATTTEAASTTIRPGPANDKPRTTVRDTSTTSSITVASSSKAKLKNGSTPRDDLGRTSPLSSIKRANTLPSKTGRPPSANGAQCSTSGRALSGSETETDQSTYITPPSSPDIAFTPVESPRGTLVAPRASISVSAPASTVASRNPSSTETRITSDVSTNAAHGTDKGTSASQGSGREAATPTTPALPPLPTANASNGNGNGGEPFLTTVVKGRDECQILRAFAMPEKTIETFKNIVYGDNPDAQTRGLSATEIETMKRAIALYDFYWFTKDLDVDVMTAFVNKVSYRQMESIADEEGYGTDDEASEASPIAMKQDGRLIAELKRDTTITSPTVGKLVDPEKAASMKHLGLPGTPSTPKRPPGAQVTPIKQRAYTMFSPSVRLPEPEAAYCPTPPNEWRVDPRTAYLDPQSKHIRALGRRCASGAALLAAAKHRLRDDLEHEHETPSAPSVASAASVVSATSTTSRASNGSASSTSVGSDDD